MFPMRGGLIGYLDSLPKEMSFRQMNCVHSCLLFGKILLRFEKCHYLNNVENILWIDQSIGREELSRFSKPCFRFLDRYVFGIFLLKLRKNSFWRFVAPATAALKGLFHRVLICWRKFSKVYKC